MEIPMSHYETFMQGPYEYRSDIRNALFARLKQITTRYARTYVVCLTIRFPQSYYSNGMNGEISDFIEALAKLYQAYSSRPSEGIALHYVWVREQDLSINPHYHVALMFDGSKLRNGWTVQSYAEAIWTHILGQQVDGCVHLSVDEPRPNQPGGLMIQKPRRKSMDTVLEAELATFDQAYNLAEHWLMYLAKTDTKGDLPKGARQWDRSKLWETHAFSPVY